MKRIALISAIALGALMTKTADAQIGINLGFRLGNGHIAARVVTPAPVQYTGDDYYYLPDMDAYYDVNDQCYFYNDGSDWVSAAYLPGYDNYDWRNFRRYEVRESRPYLRDEYYRDRFNGRVGNWGRNDNRMYADRDFRRDDNRYNDRHFDNREGWGRGQTERFNTPREFQQFNNDRFGGRGQQTERFNTPRQFEQPQQNFDRGNFDRHGNNAPVQAAPQNHGQWNRGNGGDHLSDNNMNRGMGNRFGRS